MKALRRENFTNISKILDKVSSNRWKEWNIIIYFTLQLKVERDVISHVSQRSVINSRQRRTTIKEHFSAAHSTIFRVKYGSSEIYGHIPTRYTNSCSFVTIKRIISEEREKYNMHLFKNSFAICLIACKLSFTFQAW